MAARLREHQQKNAETLIGVLSRYDSAVDASDTGTGKTFTACEVARRLQLPTLVVCPKISITQWHRTAEMFGEKLSVINYEKLRTGNTAFGRWSNNVGVLRRPLSLVCECCQQTIDPLNTGQCFAHPLGIHCVQTKKGKSVTGSFSFHTGVGMIIFDEVHRCNGLDSLNAKMLLASKEQHIKTLCLSATLAQAPIQMRALGYSLDVHGDRHDRFGFNSDVIRQVSCHPQPPVILNNFYKWLSHFGYRRDPAFMGWHWMVGAERQRETMANLNAQIIGTRGVRTTCDEIPGFPERDITAELYDLEENNEINALYSEMAEAIRLLDTKAAYDKSPNHPLTRILRARQRIELLKVPTAVELAMDSLAKGHSVGVFVNFRQTVEELCKRLDAPFIDGTVTGEPRQRVIDAFQRNETRCVVLNSAAGGISISLHDLSGDHPRVGYVMPGFSANEFRQLCGRFHREGGRSRCHYRVLLAAKTVETSVHRSLRYKLDNLDALNDCDLTPDNLPATKMKL